VSASRVGEKRGGGPWSEKVEGSEIVPDYDSHMLRCCFYLDNSIESGHRSCRELFFFGSTEPYLSLARSKSIESEFNEEYDDALAL
jgi:hypothetical protein